MTQPPLSRQIQILERVLGVQLLARTSRIVRLTPAGRKFLPEARRILQLAESATVSAQRTAAGETGSVTIGFTAVAGYRFLPELIIAARERLPDVDFVLHEMVTAEQVDALVSHRIDIALLRPPVRREFESIRVMREPLLVALPANHRLAKGRLPTLADFDRQPFVMYSPHEAQYFYDLLAAIFSKAGVAPRYVQHMPYELSTRTPEISSKRRWTETGSEVEPVMKFGSSDERSVSTGGDLASTASVVGTAESRVTRYFSTNFQ